MKSLHTRTVVAAAVLCMLLLCGNKSTGQKVDEEDAYKPSCEITIHNLVDLSGSMANKEKQCRKLLREETGDPTYDPARPCFPLLRRYMQEAYKLVSSACKSANQPNPEVSLTLFRCPRKGHKKVILEPTNDEATIEAAWKRFNDFKIGGYSCATGALEQVEEWIEASNTAQSERGGREKTPLILMLTDGNLDDTNRAVELSNQIKQESGSLTVAASVFPTSKVRKNLAAHAESTLVFDASDPDSLKGLSLNLGTHITSLGDFTTCSEEQINCVNRRTALLQGPERSCASLESLYTGIASCVGKGCIGADLTETKSKCIDESSCSLDCKDISTSLNSQDYGRISDGAAQAGYKENASTPGLVANGRLFDTEIDTPLEETWSLKYSNSSADKTKYPGTIGSPAIDGDGNIVTVSSGSMQKSLILKVDPSSGDVLWEFESFADGWFFASPIVSQDSVFVGDSNGIFYQVDLATGLLSKSWNLGPGGIYSAAAVPNAEKSNSTGRFNEYVLVAVNGVPGVTPPMLHKLWTNPSNQSIDEPREWQRQICDESKWSDGPAGGVLLLENEESSLTLSAVVPCRLGAVERYNALNGRRQWRLFTEREILSMPVIDVKSNSLYILSSNETLTGLIKYDLAGKQVWAVRVDVLSESNPLFLEEEDAVLVASEDGSLTKFRADNGKVISRRTIDEEGWDMNTLISKDSAGKVVLCESSNVHVIDPSDYKILSTLDLGSWIMGSPLLHEQSVYVSTIDFALSKLSSTSSTSPRRRLDHTSNEKWPVAAIALAVILGILFLFLAVVNIVLCKSRR